MKVKLIVEVEFDPGVTDAESLASAADRLLETILSTPKIMEEYGAPRFGAFFVGRGRVLAEKTHKSKRFKGDQPMQHKMRDYALNIDGPLLVRQRQLLLQVMGSFSRGEPYRTQIPADEELLQGVVVLLDEIADQAHDRYGLDSLIKPTGSEDHLQ